jgi:hypothetical protein
MQYAADQACPHKVRMAQGQLQAKPAHMPSRDSWHTKHVHVPNTVGLHGTPHNRWHTKHAPQTVMCLKQSTVVDWQLAIYMAAFSSLLMYLLRNFDTLGATTALQ